MITDDELRRIMPNCPQAKRALFLPHLQAAMNEFGINTYLRKAAFLAQLAHESGEFRWMEEIASGAAYEGRRDLGNTQPGDGRRYKGRGPIQLTGRANYRRYGQLLGLDLEGNPQQAATPEVGFRTAALYWKSNGLNERADAQEFKTITKRINGGFNGLADRIKYYERAKAVLSRDDAAAVTRSIPGAETRGIPAPGGGQGREVPTNLSRGILPGEEGGAAEGGAKKAAAKKSSKKAAAKKAAGGKGGAKKAAAKKAGAKKSAKKAAKKSAGKAGAKKGGAKKGAAKKSASKKGSAKKGGAKKGSAKKGGAKKGGAKGSSKKR